MRRVDCRRCGAIVVEEVRWGDGKRTLTRAYMLFLARWARRLSWKETAEAFRTSWDGDGGTRFIASGLYGVLSYGIARRSGEIAVRIAVGAQPGRVIAM